ncbi:hypothetical protein M885DRAFT_519435 [Pelagophyceae sp. CCMP2097]|nr:hypothetical protein M885DRAFT_519435 [Pelagophyceae sp. CCMP2097]
MSWFGRGNSDDQSEKTDLMVGGDGGSESVNFGAHQSEGTNFAASAHGGGGGGGGDMGSVDQEALQRIIIQEQQRALVQQVVAKLTEVSFDSCIDKPEPTLSAKSRSCIHTVVGKYLDTSEFVVGRATKQRGAE